jgi:preprotein translocase subunit SecD
MMKSYLKLCFLLLLFSCSKPEKEPEPVFLELRRAESESANDLIEMVLSGSEEKFYLHKEVLLSNEDVKSASPVLHGRRLVVEVILTDEGKEKFARLTEENINKRIGIVVDGRLILAPLVRAPIREGKMIITGNLSEEEINRIADGIVSKDEVTAID